MSLRSLGEFPSCSVHVAISVAVWILECQTLSWSCHLLEKMNKQRNCLTAVGTTPHSSSPEKSGLHMQLTLYAHDTYPELIYTKTCYIRFKNSCILGKLVVCFKL